MYNVLKLLALLALAATLSFFAHRSGLAWQFAAAHAVGQTVLVFVLTYPLMVGIDRLVSSHRSADRKAKQQMRSYIS